LNLISLSICADIIIGVDICVGISGECLFGWRGVNIFPRALSDYLQNDSKQDDNPSNGDNNDHNNGTFVCTCCCSAIIA
jgi:hypothetical protein